MAIWRRGRPRQLLHHSDRGSQYTSEAFQRLMAEHGVACSLSRSGNVWDNAAMESFFSSLKVERVARKIYRTRDQARADVFDYIERFYNPRRRHSTLGYLSPIAVEQKARLAKVGVYRTGSGSVPSIAITCGLMTSSRIARTMEGSIACSMSSMSSRTRAWRSGLRKLKAIDVIDVLSDLFILRGVPGHIRSDNGPEFVAKAVQKWIGAVGAKTAYIGPGSPWEDGSVETLNPRLRAALPHGENFSSG